MRPSQLMMIGENRHLADNATLNKHRKVPSEAVACTLSILSNHALLDHHHPTPLADQLELVRPPPGPLSLILQTFKRATSKQLHSSRSPSAQLMSRPKRAASVKNYLDPGSDEGDSDSSAPGKPSAKPSKVKVERRLNPASAYFPSDGCCLSSNASLVTYRHAAPVLRHVQRARPPHPLHEHRQGEHCGHSHGADVCRRRRAAAGDRREGQGEAARIARQTELLLRNKRADEAEREADRRARPP